MDVGEQLAEPRLDGCERLGGGCELRRDGRHLREWPRAGSEQGLLPGRGAGTRRGGASAESALVTRSVPLVKAAWSCSNICVDARW